MTHFDSDPNGWAGDPCLPDFPGDYCPGCQVVATGGDECGFCEALRQIDSGCSECHHDGEHDEDQTCLFVVGPCQCDQCLARYAAGGSVIYSDLCGCPGPEATEVAA